MVKDASLEFAARSLSSLSSLQDTASFRVRKPTDANFPLPSRETKR